MKIFKNFKEKKSFKPEFGAEGIFGGHLLGVTSSNSLSFYDWESLDLIRRIEISVKHVNLHTLTPSHPHTLTLQVYWSESGELACVASDDSYYILRYHADTVQAATSTNQGIDEDGIEAAFDVSLAQL